MLLVANDAELAVYTFELLVIMIEYDLDRGKAMQSRMVEMLFLYCFIPFAVENVGDFVWDAGMKCVFWASSGDSNCRWQPHS